MQAKEIEKSTEKVEVKRVYEQMGKKPLKQVRRNMANPKIHMPHLLIVINAYTVENITKEPNQSVLHQGRLVINATNKVISPQCADQRSDQMLNRKKHLASVITSCGQEANRKLFGLQLHFSIPATIRTGGKNGGRLLFFIHVHQFLAIKQANMSAIGLKPTDRMMKSATST